MIKLVLSYNKKKYDIQADSLKKLREVAYDVISVPPENLKIIKPAIKNEQNFKKLKDGDEVVVMGATAEKVHKEVKKAAVVERGIKYEKESIGFITYVTSSIQVLKSAINIKEFCKNQTDQNNPDLLMAIDLARIFNEIEDTTKIQPVSPIDIITSWIAYTEDEFGDFPYKAYDASLFFERILQMLQEAAVADYDQHEDDKNEIHDTMRLSYKAHEEDIQCQIQDIVELEKQDRTRHTYFLECQADPPVKNVKDGIQTYFDNSRMKVREIYGVDIKYKEKIVGFEKIPHFLLVRINRFTKEKKEGSQEEYTHTKKACQISYSKYLNLFPLCTEELQTSMKENCAKRDAIFNTFNTEYEYVEFDKEEQQKNPGCTKEEICYSFYEKNMSSEAYQKWVGRVDGKGKTGEYNLVGVVTHAGNKIEDDNSYFRGIANRSGSKRLSYLEDWFTFKEEEVKIINTSQALSFKGGPGNPENEVAYILLYKAIQF